MSFSHFDESGAARMVDTSAKEVTVRQAKARCEIRMTEETWKLIQDRKFVKGDVLEVARLAGIMAAKKTGELIPLCHPLPINSARVDFTLTTPGVINIEATVKIVDQTGVEMEALTAVSLAALTIYDMCKSVDKAMIIGNIHLAEKTGGKSGQFIHPIKNSTVE